MLVVRSKVILLFFCRASAQSTIQQLQTKVSDLELHHEDYKTQAETAQLEFVKVSEERQEIVVVGIDIWFCPGRRLDI